MAIGRLLPNAEYSFAEWCTAYRSALHDALSRISPFQLDQARREIQRAIIEDKTIFVIGNGGSHATAEHFVCDFQKGVGLANDRKVKCIALTGGPIMTAVGNDIGQDRVFEQQVYSLVRDGDLLIVISASGNSPNVVNAAKRAKEQGARVLCLVGFRAGKVSEIAHNTVYVPYEDYGIVEDAHCAVMHSLSQWFMNYGM